MTVLKAGVLYFVGVFGAGFVLGPIRILWVVPRFGARMAELMETPIMLVIIIASARWLVRRLVVPSTTSSRLGIIPLFYGASEGTRTLDLRFTKPMLYQLSYAGLRWE